MEDDLNNSVAEAGLGRFLHLVGYQNKLEEIYAAADLFLLASETEGVPGVILEAAIQSTPSVAVDVGGVSEVVRQNETGIIIPDHDATKFADSIIALLNKPAEIERLGKNASAYVTEQFHEKRNAKKFLSLYSKMKEEV
jgi:glycosyltransferase involved in cell wall biosynthesis